MNLNIFLDKFFIEYRFTLQGVELIYAHKSKIAFYCLE